MSKTGTTARWTASTGASLVLLMVVALIGAPVVGAGPGEDGGNDPVAGLFGGDGPSFFGGGGDEGGGEEGGGREGGGDEGGGREGGGDEGGGEKGGHDHGDHRGGPAVAGRAMSQGETEDYGIALRARGEGEDSRGRLAFGHRTNDGGDGFSTQGESGGEGFYGMITCLSVGEDGVAQVSGKTHEGRGHDHGDHRGGHRGDKGEEGDEGEPEDGAEDAEEPTPAAFAKGGRHGGSPDDHGDGEKGDGEEGSEDEPASRDFAFTINTQSDPQTFSLPRLGDAGTLTPCGGGEATTLEVTRGGFRVRGAN